MGIRTARLPENLEEYLKILITKGYASNYGNAINLIILERMMTDKEKGTVTPFRYKLKDARRTGTKDISEIGTENIENPITFPLGEPPAIAGPCPAREIETTSKRSEEKPASYFGEINKPAFPGSMEEYREALRLRAITENQFRPPE